MEFETLHATSLRLVGRGPKSSSSMTKHVAFHGTDSDVAKMKKKPQFKTLHSNPYRTNRAMEKATTKSKGKMAVADTVSIVSGPDDERWRRHGGARRLQLLEEDRLKGGQDFTLSFDCSVERYFQVARWALEQFHQLYESGMNLEDTYVMGHRIVTFLTDCLPQHPGLFRSPEVRERTRNELERLQECLEDLAVRIDEEECNHFVANFDPALLAMEDDDDDDVTEDSTVEDEDEDENSLSTSGDKMICTPPKGGSNSSLVGDDAKRTRLVRFEDWEDFPKSGSQDVDTPLYDRKHVESPTAETVGTTGTGSSIEPLDSFNVSSSSDEIGRESRYSPELHTNTSNSHTARSSDYVSDSEDDTSNGEDEKSSSSHLYPVHVRLDFLERIANEEVEYETDSEAADSWAQGDGESAYNGPAPSSSAGAPTCDPARIAFREMMKRLPLNTCSWSEVVNREDGNCPSPTFLDILSKSIKATSGNKSIAEDQVDGDCQKTLQKEERVESEIQRYLESEEDDAEIFIATCHNKLRTNDSPNSSIIGGDGHKSDTSLLSERRIIPSSDSSFSRYSPSNKPSQEATEESPATFDSFQDNFLDDDTWVAFDNSQSRVPVNFFAANN